MTLQQVLKLNVKNKWLAYMGLITFAYGLYRLSEPHPLFAVSYFVIAAWQLRASFK